MERDAEIAGAHGDEEWLVILPDLVVGKHPGTLSERRARLWALVLDARSVPCRLDFSEGNWHVLVPAESHGSAISELRLFEEENRNWPPPPPPSHPLTENTLATLSVLILVAIFHNIIRLDDLLPMTAAPDWIALGSARADKIMDGQWWRLITALTLHADDLHLVSNLAIGGIFILLLCRELGSGLAWALMLGSGILGNLANAWVQSASHRSVGASTLVFGAVGILASLGAVRYRHQLRRRWALPIASALALLALLGTEGRNTDLGAHLFGFAFGIGLGLVAEYGVGKQGLPGRALNAMLALLCVGVVAVAWWMALIVHVAD